MGTVDCFIPKWVSDAIFYEIFPDRFSNGDPGNDPPNTELWGGTPQLTNFYGGDLQGIIDRLSYLNNLGVTALYLTPIFKANTNHKYDASDYLTIDPAFGDTELLKELVSAAHERGMRIILDAVFNHCGEGFWAFEDVKKKGLHLNTLRGFLLTYIPFPRIRLIIKPAVESGICPN